MPEQFHERASEVLERPRTLMLLLLVAMSGWAAFMFFQYGFPFDEGEHLHAAWLMSQGLKPIDDFFEHHQPVLWDVLRAGFAFGFTGGTIMIWGRLVVLVCGFASVWSLYSLGKRWGLAGGTALPGLAGIAFFLLFTMAVPQLFIIRPESLSIPLVLLALVAWTRSPASQRQRWLVAFVAGVSFGASVYTSPRIALTGGLFLLVPVEVPEPLLRTWRKWGLFIAGAVCFVVGYTSVSGFPLKHALFNAEFSALLQTVGANLAGPFFFQWACLFGSVAVSNLALVMAGDRASRLRGALLLGYSLTCFLVSDAVAHSFRYPQQYTPAVISFCVAFAYAGAHLARPFSQRQWISVAIAWLTPTTFVALAFIMSGSHPPAFDMLDLMEARESYTALVPAGQKMLVQPMHAPVDVRDASYYGFGLLEGKERLCRAVGAWHGEPSLPPCDEAEALLKTRPALVDISWLSIVGDPAKKRAVQQMFDAEYVAVHPPGDGDPALLGIRIRKSIADSLLAQ